MGGGLSEWHLLQHDQSCADNLLGEPEAGKKQTVGPVEEGNGHGSIPNLYKLVHIEADQLESSFVEKIMVARDQIISLCNAMAPSSANVCGNKVSVDFDRLNEMQMHVLGLYGSKEVLSDFLSKLHPFVSKNMKESSLDPGLYGLHCEDSLFVFYWHEGDRMQEASRKDICCNFVRYVMDLCNKVYVCLDEQDMRASVAVSSCRNAVSKRKPRSQRYQLSRDKKLDSEINLRAGFPAMSFEQNPEDVSIPKGNRELSPSCVSPLASMRLCEGRSCCGVLIPSYTDCAGMFKTRTEKLKASEVPDVVEKWCSTYTINVDSLSDEELVLFLTHASKVKGSNRYKALEESFAQKRDGLCPKVVNVGDELQQLFGRLMKVYLRAFHEKEEVIWGMTPSRPGSNSFEDNRELDAASMPVLADISNLKRDLCKLWTGSHDKIEQDQTVGHHFVFPGEEFTLLLEDTKQTFKLPSHDACVFMVKGHQSGTSLGPIRLYEEFPASLKQASEKVITVRVCPMADNQPVGPLITSEPYRVTLEICEDGGSEATSLVATIRLVQDSVQAQGILNWIHSFGEAHIPHQLARTGNLLSVLMRHPQDFGADVCSFIKRVTHQMASLSGQAPRGPLDYFKMKFSVEQLRSWWQMIQLKADLGEVIATDLPLDPGVHEACKLVYQEACSRLSAALSSFVRKEILPEVEKISSFYFAKAEQELGRTLCEEKRKLLGDLRQEMATERGLEPTLKLIRFYSPPKKQSLISRLSRWNSKTEPTHPEIEVQYLCQGTRQQQPLSWKLHTLAPLQKDLEKLVSYKEHTIVPSWRSVQSLITLDPSREELGKVFATESGETLIFVKRKGCLSLEYLSRKIGTATNRKVIKEFKRGCDLVAFDEALKLLAMYDKKMGKVEVYKLEKGWTRLSPELGDVTLGQYSGCRDLLFLLFRTGKRELILIAQDLTVRVCDIGTLGRYAVKKPKTLVLGELPSHCCVTLDGSCLLAFYKGITDVRSNGNNFTVCGVGDSSPHDQDEKRVQGNDTSEPDSDGTLVIELYNLDKMSFVETVTVPVDTFAVADIRSINAGFVKFSSQVHLVLFDSSRPGRGICSLIVDGTSDSRLCHLVKVDENLKGHVALEAKGETCPALDYISLVFEKYSTSTPLQHRERNLEVHLLMGRSQLAVANVNEFQGNAVRYVKASLENVEKNEGKGFSELRISIMTGHLPESFESQTGFVGIPREKGPVSFGDWIRLLVCLVPLQVARAERNSLRPLSGGLQIPPDMEYTDAISLANLIGFSFYDAVLNHWPGSVKVVSTMGKQSSGKSYLLNHLSGSLLDVAGGRCTDGVWMTIRHSKDCLYVLMDFEGLGSFERSEQEDMLMSVLNAAISNITIFNKKDSHLDKETETVFGRFQSGVNLVKQDTLLFQGLFLLAVKDVAGSDLDDLEHEFYEKLVLICGKSPQSFLSNMYRGEIKVMAMPPFQEPDFYETINEIALTVENLPTVYQSARRLSTDLKLVIAQMSTQDWAPINSKRAALRIDEIGKNLETAVLFGRLDQGSEGGMFRSFDTQEVVPDEQVVMNNQLFDVWDTNLGLCPWMSQESELHEQDTLRQLRAMFESFTTQSRDNDETWHHEYETFLIRLADRRSKRVLQWLDTNTSDIQSDGDVVKLRLEAVSMLGDLRQRLSVCSCKCDKCFFRCVLDKNHETEPQHDCKGQHKCAAPCDFCPDLSGNECGLASGHHGQHDCKNRSHTCGEDCSLSQKSSNCSLLCALEMKHSGEHMCSTRQHICDEACSLPGCTNSCAVFVDSSKHSSHACHERMCPRTCKMPGCNRKCGSDDHFHAMVSNDHLCGSEHPCQAICEATGSCEIATQLCKTVQTFKGKRAEFLYDHISEQNGIKKGCCHVIPPWKESHEGPHSHTMNPDAVHYCEVRCQGCKYFCTLPEGHFGRHTTTHGNMRELHFVSEEEHIDILDRAYVWGESGVAELCHMYCKAQGRGHVHLLKCREQEPYGTCAAKMYPQGARHETTQYGPDLDVAKDEFTHREFWNHMKFEDPSQLDDQSEFGLCNHHCRSEEHEELVDPTNCEQKSYCIGRLWHEPVQSAPSHSKGYVSKDGHLFSCSHPDTAAHHILFLIDRSSSMAEHDIKPSFSSHLAFTGHNNRLGCVYEAIQRFMEIRFLAGCNDLVSFILFSHEAEVVVKCELVDGYVRIEELLAKLLVKKPCGGTSYLRALNSAHALLPRLPDVDVDREPPAVIFLSDGENSSEEGDPVVAIVHMKRKAPDLVLHTILFGSHSEDSIPLLERMAEAGGGTFNQSIDELALTKNMYMLARSLREPVASLM